MKLPTLYKQGNRGLEQWNVEVIDHMHESEILVTWGMVNGAMQTKSTLISEGKNIGKSNETTFKEQARLEAKSKWQKQIDRKGYSETVQAANTKKETKIRPMLAKVYADHKHKLKFPCYIQPKLDGMRALTYLVDGEVVMMSRQGKEIVTTEHIKNELKYVLHDDLVLDGELYQHGEKFQSLISKVKRDEANNESKEVQYHVYDCFYASNPEKIYDKRIDDLQLHVLYKKLTHTKYVITGKCLNESDIFEYHKSFLKEGYEGSIIRGANAPYKIDGRSDQLLKLKDFKDAEYEVYNFEVDKNGHPVFVCQTDDGKLFNVKPEGSDEERKELLERIHEYIGQEITVKYFELTDDGIPRFPVAISVIRNYE